MEDIVYKTLLFDFYGELLTEHRRNVYEDFICNDLSESEIAQEAGVSRQAAHDMIHKCEKALEQYEEKLGHVKRFMELRDKVVAIKELTNDEAIKRLCDEIVEGL